MFLDIMSVVFTTILVAGVACATPRVLTVPETDGEADYQHPEQPLIDLGLTDNRRPAPRIKEGELIVSVRTLAKEWGILPPFLLPRPCCHSLTDTTVTTVTTVRLLYQPAERLLTFHAGLPGAESTHLGLGKCVVFATRRYNPRQCGHGDR